MGNPKIGYVCPVRQAVWNGYYWACLCDGQPLDELTFQRLLKVVDNVMELYQ